MPTNKEIELTLTLRDEASKNLKSARASIKEFTNSTKDSIAPILQLRQAWMKVSLAGAVTVGTMIKGVQEIEALRKEIDSLDISAIKLGTTSSALSKKMYGFDITTESIRIGAAQAHAVTKEASDLWTRTKATAAGIWGNIAVWNRASSIQADKILASSRSGKVNASAGGSYADAAALAKEQLLAEEQARKQGSAEAIKINSDLYSRTAQLVLSEYQYKKKVLSVELREYQKIGADKTQLAEYQAAYTKRLEEDRTIAFKSQTAARLKAEGDTLGAMRLEQQNALVEYKRIYGGDGEMVQEFIKSQNAMYRQARLSYLGIKSEYQIMHDGFVDVVGNMTSTFSDVFYNSVTGEVKSLSSIFQSFGKSILKTLSDMLAQYIVMKSIMGITSLFSGGSTISGGVGGTTTSTSQFGTVWSQYHKGGVVRNQYGNWRRAHNGMAINRLSNDEVPIVAKVGEGIINPIGMSTLGRSNFEKINRGESVGGTTINPTIVITAWDASDISRNSEQIEAIFAKAMRSNSQLVRGSVRRYS